MGTYQVNEVGRGRRSLPTGPVGDLTTFKVELKSSGFIALVDREGIGGLGSPGQGKKSGALHGVAVMVPCLT